MNVTAGRKSFFKPTPSGLMFWTDVYMAVAGQFIGWIKSTELIGHHTGDVISEILGQTLMYVIIGRKFFGINTTEKTVSIDKVSTMDNDVTKMLYLVLCYDIIRYLMF